MPAFQSVANLGLPQRYYLNAVGCEKQARNATDQTAEKQWRELAAEWHSMADRAADLQYEAPQHELE
jgi:hypothetical protein